MFPKSKYAYPPVKPSSSSSSSFYLTPLQKKTCIRSALVDEVGPIVSILDDGTQRIRTRTRLPKSTTVEAIIEMYCERPLPAIPRIPSSIYAFSKDSTVTPQALSPTPTGLSQASNPPQTPVKPPISLTQTTISTAKGLASAKHLSQLYRKEATRQPSTPRSVSERQTPILERQTPILERQTPLLELQPKDTLETKVIVTKPVPFTEWKAPTYTEPSISSQSSFYIHGTQQTSILSSSSSSRAGEEIADKGAASGTIMSHTGSINLTQNTYDHGLDGGRANPTLPLPNTKGVARRAGVPYPLRTDLPVEALPQSRFSPISPNASEIDSLAGVASSFRARAKKALFSSKTAKRPGLKRRLATNRSEVLHILPTPKLPPRKVESANLQLPGRESTEQDLSETPDTSQSAYLPAEHLPTTPKAPHISRLDRASLPKKLVPTDELHILGIALEDKLDYGRNAWREPARHPYVYRVPRKRLSRPRMPVASTTIPKTNEILDTTYKIEMPSSATPKQPRVSQLFDYTCHDDLVSTTISAFRHSSSFVVPTRNGKTKSHRYSLSIPSPSSYGTCPSSPLSQSEDQHLRRYSVPSMVPSRQNSSDTVSTTYTGRAIDSGLGSMEDMSQEDKLASISLKPGLITSGMESVTSLALDSDREKGQWRSERLRTKDEGRGRQTIREERREELKKRIVVMGDPSTVGVPF